jgi:hypothetical protein
VKPSNRTARAPEKPKLDRGRRAARVVAGGVRARVWNSAGLYIYIQVSNRNYPFCTTRDR